MKRIITIISVLGIFALASCNEPIYDDGTNTNQTSISNTTQNNQTETTSAPDDDVNNTTNTSKENDSSNNDVYDDGIEWGPLH